MSVTPLLGHKIRHGQAMEWSTPRRPALLPVGFVEPCLPSVRATAPRGREWVHEIKFNGIRLIVRRDGKRARDAAGFRLDRTLSVDRGRTKSVGYAARRIGPCV